MDEKTLDKIEPGNTAVVTRVGRHGHGRRRLMAMGMVPGAEIEVLRKAPMGDPVEYRIKGYCLSMRKADASEIEVRPNGGTNGFSRPLATLPAGDMGRVVGLHAGRGLARRLDGMGFSVGSEVRVVRAGRGKLRVELEGREVAVGKGMAMKIMVEAL